MALEKIDIDTLDPAATIVVATALAGLRQIGYNGSEQTLRLLPPQRSKRP